MSRRTSGSLKKPVSGIEDIATTPLSIRVA
jgi:hypothetical protein